MSKKEAKIRRRVYSFIDKMSNEIGVKIPRENYPEVKTSVRNGSMYNPKTNTLIIALKDAHFGDVYGEEVGHYIRHQLQPKNDPNEKLTSEFFGYLGRKILQKLTPSKKDLTFKMEKSIDTRKEALELIKGYKEIEKQYEEYASGKKQYPLGIFTPKYAGLGVEKAQNKRRDVLEHFRGYKFAQNIDLNQVDYEELYSLPNQEVRKRFFRKDPMYHNRSLENKVSVILVLSILAFIILSQANITGNVINESLKFKVSIIPLIITISCGLFLIYKKMKN